MREDLCVSSQALCVRPPDEFHFLLLQPLGSVLIVKPSKEPCIKTHFCKQPRIGIGMAKWINLPPYPWLDSELLEDEVMANHHVVNHVLERWARFIMHRPSTVDQLKLPTFYKVSDVLLHFIGLLLPPHVEVFHLDF